MLIFMFFFVPQMSIIFVISTSNNPIINTIYLRGGVLQPDTYYLAS